MSLNTSQNTDPKQYAGYLIWQISNKWEQYVNSILKPFAITQSEYLHLVALTTLEQTTPHPTLVSIAKEAGCTIANTTKITKRLQAKSFVSIVKSSADKRAKSINITPSGKDVAMQAAFLLLQANNDFFQQNSTSRLTLLLQNIISHNS
jgi:DNA-binding MarR family transcriptional regulator